MFGKGQQTLADLPCLLNFRPQLMEGAQPVQQVNGRSVIAEMFGEPERTCRVAA